jgi:hypothetical protein
MKYIKTANGIKRIDEGNGTLVAFQLRAILQEHRATLIDKLISGGLETYIDYRFMSKPDTKRLQGVREKLIELRNSSIDMHFYRSISEMVDKSEFTYLDNIIFYIEIDKIIKINLAESPLFPEGRRVFLQ